jgi:hypothetical protein
MLVSNDLAKDMIDATSSGDPTTSMASLGTAIANYIIANAELVGQFVGALIAPPNSPVSAPLTGKIVSCTITMSYCQSMADMALMVYNGVSAATFAWNSPFVGPPAIIAIPTPPPLTPTGSNVQLVSMRALATQITSWINAWTPIAPITGIYNTTASGTATATGPIV